MASYSNYQPSVGITYGINLYGIYPSEGVLPDQPVISQVSMFAFDSSRLGQSSFGTQYLAATNGQSLSIAQYQAVFSLLGTTYGGNGQTTFQLPNLQGQLTTGAGASTTGLGNINIGTTVGLAITPNFNQSYLPASAGGSGATFSNVQPTTGLNYYINISGFYPSDGPPTLDTLGMITQMASVRDVSGQGMMMCAGQTLQIQQYAALYSIIGNTYGGDGITTFRLPDLRGYTVIGTDEYHPEGWTSGSATTSITQSNLPIDMGGGGIAVNNDQPSIAMDYIIATDETGSIGNAGDDSLLDGQIAIFAGDAARFGWQKADGSLLQIGDNPYLFSLIGTTYGGDGQNTFAVPDLGGKATIDAGTSAAGTIFDGQTVGSDGYTLKDTDFGVLTITASVARQTIYGGGYGDTLTAGSDSNTLVGNGGDDLLIGGAGNDNFQGGAGNDTLSYANATSGVTVSLALQGSAQNTVGAGSDTLSSIEKLVGSAYADTLISGSVPTPVGSGGGLVEYSVDSWLSGGAGDDTLISGGYTDTLDGGDGNDTVSYAGLLGGGVIVSLALQGSAQNSGAGGIDTLTNIENLTGSGFNDTLFGDAGNNVLNGGDGDDVLVGGAGADTLNGGAGSNTAAYGSAAGAVTVDLENGVLNTGDAAGDTFSNIQNINGSSFDDALYGDADANVLQGGAGNDILDGRDGADILSGGTGDDTYYIDNVGDVVNEASATGGNDTIYASVSYSLHGRYVETLDLTGTGNINATGNGQANTLNGNAGNNVLDGAGGADTMAGGLGDDTYIVDNADDVVIENFGAGTDTVKASVSYTLDDNVENLVLTGSGAIDGTGNDLVNVITGNSAANTIDGGQSADTMSGGNGDDIYYVDNVGDNVVEGATGGNDTIYSSVSYSLKGRYVETLTLTGTALNATGNNQANTLNGDDLANTLDGQGGADVMAGGLGDDTYIVDNAGDVVTENADAGTDTVKASVSYTLSDNVENLTLTGSQGINGTGNALANVIIGNAAANTLDGGSGADTMSGGNGDDTYYVDDAGDAVIESSATGGNDAIFSTVSYSLAGRYVETLTLIGSDAINATGNNQANTLIGNDGANILNGMGGSDVLTGGMGADTFEFGSALGVSNIDTITDFTVGEDMIQLDRSIFYRAGAVGALSDAAFSTGTAATTAAQRIIYDQTTGDLFYDADGSGSGAQIQIATLSKNLALTASSFRVV